jgi:peptidyl-prolyl cis-trans isomerase A (cyclophilin A)
MSIRQVAGVSLLVFGIVATACQPAPEEPAPAAPRDTEVAPKPAPKPEEPAVAPGGVNMTRLAVPAALGEEAPPTFKVAFDTSKGQFVVEATRAWAPRGVDRFYNLVKNGFYHDVRFYRVVPGFMVQFGIHGDPKIMGPWTAARIPDDPVTEGNARGYVTFAHGGPNSRTTQLFINFRDNSSALNKQGFTAIGRVISGMDVVDALYSGYGEMAPRGKGPDQQRFIKEGNAYLASSFPNLDYIKSATIVQ